MIKVLSKGERYKVDCNFCNSSLEYGIEDITTEEGVEPYYDNWYGMWRGVKIYLICPVCGHHIPQKRLKPYQGDENE